MTLQQENNERYRAASAKQPATQQKRIQEVFDIMTGKRDMRGKPVKPQVSK